MLAKKFIISWFASAIIMFILSYVWHGVVLNDFNMLSIPLGLYLLFASIVYLVAGAIVSKAYTIDIFGKVSRHPLLRGMVAGSVCGIMLFIVSMVIGLSFSKTMTMQFLLIDMTWQVIEQGLGGLAVGLVHIFVWDDSMIRPEDLD